MFLIVNSHLYFMQSENHIFSQSTDGQKGKYLSHIGIFQMSCQQENPIYGIGIYRNLNILVTLAQYFNIAKKLPVKSTLPYHCSSASRRRLNIFVTKRMVINFPQMGDLKEQKWMKYSHIQFTIESLKDLSLKEGIIYSSTAQDNQFKFFKKSFETMVNRIDCKDEVGLIFVYRKDKVMVLYGFYNNLKQERKDQYISEQKLQNPNKAEKAQKSKELKSESIYYQDKMQLVQLPNQYPYCSIGMLLSYNHKKQYIGYPSKGIQGTAFCLSKDTKCKFIMTCAHNFYNKQGNIIDHRHPQSLKNYTFLTAKYASSINVLNRKVDMKKDDTFEILNLYIPEIYEKYIDQAKSGHHNLSNQDKSLYFYYDIAVIELKTPIVIEKGFVIKSKQQLPSKAQLKGINAEVAGFPGQSKEKANKGATIENGCMYHGSVKNHGNQETCFFIRNQGPMQVIEHRLSTLQGNSGSPIFINDQIKKLCYLLGVHVAGCSNYNLATYIYNSVIYQWLEKIEGIQIVIERPETEKIKQAAKKKQSDSI